MDNPITVKDLLSLVMENDLSLDTVICAIEEDNSARLFEAAFVNNGEDDSQPVIELC